MTTPLFGNDYSFGMGCRSCLRDPWPSDDDDGMANMLRDGDRHTAYGP
jgi:hypothetical protein